MHERVQKILLSNTNFRAEMKLDNFCEGLTPMTEDILIDRYMNLGHAVKIVLNVHRTLHDVDMIRNSLLFINNFNYSQ